MANNCSFNDPLYIHPSDTPGTNLVSDPLIGVENYGVWSRAMLIALRAKNKIALIDGSCPRPPVAVWTDLKEQFDKINGSRIFSLHREIGRLTQVAYYCKLKQLWDEYSALVILPSCECDAAKKYVEHEQQQRLLQFLMGLNESYMNIRSQILMICPLPMVGHAFSLLSQEESHRALSTVEAPTSAFYTNQTKLGSSVKERFNLFCDHCNLGGHTKEYCYKLVGYLSCTNYIKLRIRD
ncbi:uncharacterized protein [Primulina eburnea]|uniref:uncharacterized protein n=1 Tax=Primulina eburnea TaxID=1245227 RepID=UPI003C6BE369